LPGKLNDDAEDFVTGQLPPTPVEPVQPQFASPPTEPAFEVI